MVQKIHSGWSQLHLLHLPTRKGRSFSASNLCFLKGAFLVLLTAMAYVAGIVNTLITPFYNIVFKHVMYPFTASRNVKHLKEATQGLIAKGSDVRYQVEIAERNGMTTKNEVQRWLENVDTIKSDEEAISQMYDERCKVFGASL